MNQLVLLQGQLACFFDWQGFLVEVYLDRGAYRARPHPSNDPTLVHLDWRVAFPSTLRMAEDLYAVERLTEVWRLRPFYRCGGRIRRQRDGAVFNARGKSRP